MRLHPWHLPCGVSSGHPGTEQGLSARSITRTVAFPERPSPGHVGTYSARMPGWLLAVGPIAAFIGGYLFRYVGDYLNARWRRASEQAARDHERERLLRERREQFELETLARLTDSLRDLGDVAAEVVLAATDGLLDKGAPKTERVPPPVSRRADNATREVFVTAELILEETLRKAISATASMISREQLLSNDTAAEMVHQYNEAVAHLDLSRQFVASRIRGIYLAWDIPLEPSPQPTDVKHSEPGRTKPPA